MGYLLAPQSVVVGSLSEQEVLEQAPGQPAVHGELEEHGLGARVWRRLPTAQTQEELDKPAHTHTHTC